MMPKVVPNRPTKGAVEPMVARPERPRFRSARFTAVARWMARLAASTARVLVALGLADLLLVLPLLQARPPAPWPGGSASLLCRAEASIASLILPCFRKRATSGAYLRDCLVAWR